MVDANGSEEGLGPPLERREADLIWHAPAEGLSGTLVFVLLMNAALVLLLFLSGLILLAFTVLGTLVLLVVFFHCKFKCTSTNFVCCKCWFTIQFF